MIVYVCKFLSGTDSNYVQKWVETIMTSME